MITGKILLVTGSRTIVDRDAVFAALDALGELPSMLVHGGALGVDSLAGRWAKSHNIPVKIVKVNFREFPVRTFGWKGYLERDKDMVRMADAVVGIWDGSSTGTKYTIDFARTEGKLHSVVTLQVRKIDIVAKIDKFGK